MFIAMSDKRLKVIVGMSGGVDSSVSAALLVEQGYEVVGAFMKNWSDTKDIKGECAWRTERRDAMAVAARLDIPFITFDFEREYKENVVSYMFREYEAGHTPNPDVMCNSFIKFPLFWAEAKKLRADFIATGHYARTENGKLLLSADEEKDQTYFLQRITKEDLEHTLFPVGHLTKPQVRELARKFKLPVAEKKDSTGICFIGEVSMEEFLSQRIPKKQGNIITVEGEVVGTHNGVWFYTIGQRHGFGGGGGKPYFVVDRNLEKNELIVAPGADHPRLYKKEIEISDIHWISGKEPGLPLVCQVRIRHRGELFDAVLELQVPQNGIPSFPLKKIKESGGTKSYKLKAKEPQRAATPGQMAAIYVGDECLGGGVIL